MTRETLLIILGIALALTPFLGLPYSWLMVLVPLLSAGVIVIGITLRKKRSDAAAKTERDTERTYEAGEA